MSRAGGPGSGLSNAIVVGGGIGGLACATALARQGVAVTLLEQAPDFSEIGAGLQISPNGLAVLRALGLEAGLKARGAVRGQAVHLCDYAQGAQVARLDLTRLAAEQRYYFVHRADLVDLLRAAAQEANVSFETGAQVASLHPAALPQVQMASGGRRRAELVVSADGIHSVGRVQLNGADKAAFSGQVAWRALIPNDIDHGPEARVTMGPGRHLVSYPLRDGRLINLVAVEERSDWAAEGWHHADNPAHLRRAFAGFGGAAAQMIEAVKEVTLWGLHHHPVAANWQGEGVALLGDAAHPTLPFLAQGANMALEDAWVLADCLRRQPRDAALAAYQAKRITRARRIVKTSEGNAARYHMAPGPLRFAAHSGLRLASKLAPSLMLGAYDWLYGHDVTKA
ncbi:FAD-dependent monooxygenase [Sulfitobacter sp. PS-8MA]|uniref:FAD-dependent monooxygenase n=1 Tax=Sulfitobacter sp. PS-8MA TaxID=3237707 RepID=UPI0034C6AA26